MPRRSNALAVVEVLVLVAQDRQRSPPRSRPASAGTGPVQASWCASGVSGRVMPTMRRDLRAPDAGAADHDVGRDLALVGDARRSPVPSVDRDVEHLVPRQQRAPPRAARASLRVARRARPWRGRRWGRAGRRGPRSGSSSGCSVGAVLGGVEQARLDAPGGEPAVPAVQLGERARGVVATSRPPTWRKHGSPSTSRPQNFSTV